MRTFILTLTISALSYTGIAQVKTAHLDGSIHIPTLVDLDVDFAVNDFNLRFDEWEQMDNGRVYQNAIHVYVKSNAPWIVKVKSRDPYYNSLSVQGSTNIPSQLISIRPSGSPDFLPLTTAQQTILASTNNNIENHYYLDLKMDTNWISNGGNYNLNVAFSLSAP